MKLHDFQVNMSMPQMRKLAKGGNIRLSKEQLNGHHHIKVTKKQLTKLNKARRNKTGAEISLTNEQLKGSGFFDWLKPVGRALAPVGDFALGIAKPIVGDVARTALTGALTGALGGKGRRKAPAKKAPAKKGGNPFLASLLAPVAINAFRGLTGLGKKGKAGKKPAQADLDLMEGEGIIDDIKEGAKRGFNAIRNAGSRGLNAVRNIGQQAYDEFGRPIINDLIHDASEYARSAVHNVIDEVKADPMGAVTRARRAIGFGRKGGSFVPAGGRGRGRKRGGSFNPAGY